MRLHISLAWSVIWGPPIVVLEISFDNAGPRPWALDRNIFEFNCEFRCLECRKADTGHEWMKCWTMIMKLQII